MKLIIPDNIPRRKRRILGPLGRLLMKVCNWKIVGEFPTHKRMVLIGVPHTAMRDAWYALLAVLALDLKINFFGLSLNLIDVDLTPIISSSLIS